MSKKIIGNYQLLEKIAEGGFGETYKAEHIVTKKLSCIKYAINLDPDDEKILIEEARAMWELRHYGIPSIRDLIRMPDSKLGLVMSYIEGLTLAQIIETHYPNGMEPEHVAWITDRILNVLKYLHMHGIVHGDIKPQNIVVQPESHTIVLLDYGLSLFKPKANTVAKGYTPYFCAPEQEGFEKGLLPETDLYGLGMTMIFALGGDVAHVRVPETTPKSMCEFIKKMIRRDPLKRPKIWTEDICESLQQVRLKDFGRATSGMKPLKL